ncbi:MAG: LytTR family DNA-binding domain-containing protein [Gemmatimonadaceae bacterium]
MSDSPLRAVLVDDEPLARDGLAAELARYENVEVVATCASAAEACDAITRLRPELLFLDVEMPEHDGFAVLERLEPEVLPPAVIFVTAYDAHAIRAFEAHALDFVLKPVSRERLRAAVDRAVARVGELRLLAAAALAPETAAAETYLERILVPERGRTLVLAVPELDWVEAETYYVRLHAGAQSRLLRERMSVLDAKLDPAHFFRVHRSAIVNLARVREVRTLSKYEHEAVLEDGTRVRVSRDRRARLEALLRSR